MMRTTLTLDDDVAARLKELSRASGASFKAVVNETLRRGLSTPEKLAPEGPFVVKARPLRKRSGVQLDNIGELLEQIDGAAHR
jgi:hypothetical protein